MSYAMLIESPFRVCRVVAGGQRNHVLDGAQIPTGEEEALWGIILRHAHSGMPGVDILNLIHKRAAVMRPLATSPLQLLVAKLLENYSTTTAQLLVGLSSGLVDLSQQ